MSDLSSKVNDEMVDFGGPLPPDVPDGQWDVRVSIGKIQTSKEKGTKYQKIEYTLIGTPTEEHKHFVTTAAKVESFFMPKAPNDPYFRFFMAEVKDLCKKFEVRPPVLAKDKVGDIDAWQDFLTELNGKEATIWTVAKVDKGGFCKAQVKFTEPKPALPATTE